MFSRSRLVAVVAVLALGVFVTAAYATHSWGTYHWGRKANPFTVKLGDNVSSAWDAYLVGASGDWSQSSVLDTSVVSGLTSPKYCRPTSGRVEVCSRGYGYNGWLGVASIWVSGSHIVQGTVKVNDTYFNTTTYNTPAWRKFVMCQEVGHTFGLDHQDENFSNPNLGTCMDYTSDPDGTLYGQLSNEHPNLHDYDQLETIYGHVDSITTVGQSVASARNHADSDSDEEGPAKWGKEIRKSRDGRSSLYESDHGRGQKVFTFVLWTE